MRKISEKEIFSGQWVAVDEVVFETKEGATIRWESVRRKNDVTAVAIIAQLMPSKRFVVIRQFRPAINGYILGFPAGLIHEGDQQIITELKEETGYIGRLIHKSPLIKANPGLMNSGGHVAYVQIDENDPLNKDPQQELEPAEEIEVHLVKREDMQDFLSQQQAAGTHIGGGLWYLFVLMEMIQ